MGVLFIYYGFNRKTPWLSAPSLRLSELQKNVKKWGDGLYIKN